MNRNVNSEEGLHSCGYHDGKRATQPAQEPPSEWAAIKAILDEYGLQAIDFVANFKATLAQPAQEPVKDWVASHNSICALLRQAHDALALTSYPPKRPWVGLTDDEIKDIIGSWGDTPIKGYTRKLFDQIEAKLKEKNND